MEAQLDNIDITPQLWTRAPRPADAIAELTAMRRIGEAMVRDPAQMLAVCVEVALKLCSADTCGISLRSQSDDGADIFRWVALTGELAPHLHGTTPRNFSPCGVAVDSSAPLLMRRPELHYTYLDVGPPFQDVLLIPLGDKGDDVEGTIWVVAHNEERKFDAEDARVMQRIAVFISTTLAVIQSASDARAEAALQQVMFRELDHRVKNTLSMTAGLLQLQLARIPDTGARAAIESAVKRVITIGRIHDIGSAASRDMTELTRTVCKDVLGDDPRFNCAVDAEAIVLPTHRAVVVALIVNELLTNVAKHALAGRDRADVAIALKRTTKDMLELTVSDDGPSFEKPSGSHSGVGMKLVERLAVQLGGKLIVETEPKEFRIVFPEKWDEPIRPR